MTPHHHCTPVLLCGEMWWRCQPRPSHVQSVEEVGVHRRSLTAIPAKVPRCIQSRVAGPEEWRPTAEVLRANRKPRGWTETYQQDISNICKFSECPMSASRRQLSSPVPIFSPSERNAKTSHRNEDFIYQTWGFFINTKKMNQNQNEGLSDKEDVALGLWFFQPFFQPFCPCRLPDFEAQDDLDDRKERWSQRAPATVPSAAGATAGRARWMSGSKGANLSWVVATATL